MGMTKTSFMRGMQCPKMLWLDKHKPEMQVIPPDVQKRLDKGNEFGDIAMGMFGPYEEMTVYFPGTKIPDTQSMLAKTSLHLTLGTPVICEAAFSNYNNYCAVDILRKTDFGYDIYEVKNSPSVSDQHVRDAAYQNYIVSRCKIKVGRIFIVLPGQNDKNPFSTFDVTRDAKGYYRWINDNIWYLNRMQKKTEEIIITPGEQCLKPYECWYYQYCHSKN